MGITPTPEHLFVVFLIVSMIASFAAGALGFRTGYRDGYRNGYQDRQVKIRWAREELKKEN